MLYVDTFFDEFIDTWKAWAAEADGVPNRRQMNPARMQKLLPYIYMLEWTGNAAFEIRLRGTGIEYSTQHSFKVGAHFDRYSEDEWALMGKYFDTIYAGPCGALGNWRFYTKEGKVFDAVTVSLPLWSRDGERRLAIGMMSIASNHDVDLMKGPQDHETSDILSNDYFDVGFGLPEGAGSYRP